MDWPSLGTAVVLSAIGAGVGYALSLWRNRVRPWVGVLGMHWSNQADEPASLPDAVRDLQWKSWFVQQIPRKEALGDLLEIDAQADQFLSATENTDQVLEKAIAGLQDHQGADEVTSSLFDLFMDEGFGMAMSLALDFDAIKITPSATGRDSVLSYYVEEDDQGTIVALEFPRQFFRIDAPTPVLRDKVLAFFEVVSTLDVDRLRPLLRSLRGAVTEQRDYGHRIRNAAKPTMEGRSRFSCSFTVTNFGATPFVVSDRGVQIAIKREHQVDRLECSLLEGDEEGDLVMAPAVTVVAPGETRLFVAAAISPIDELQNGDELKGAFKKGASTARVQVLLMGREFSAFKETSSQDVLFAEG
jgi:hypothetical protein